MPSKFGPFIESQRWNVHERKWQSAALRPKLGDPSRWSFTDGSAYAETANKPTLPAVEDLEVKPEWFTAVFTFANDQFGFSYATDFQSEFKNANFPAAYARQRVWRIDQTRTTMYEEPVEPENPEHKFSPHAILERNREMITAAKGGHLQIVKDIVNAGGDKDHQDAATFDKFTALHFASQKNFVDIAGFLLSVGANPSILDGVGQSALACAVQAGNVDIMKMLIVAGADKSWSLEGNDLLHVAVTAGRDKALDLLLDEGLGKERQNSDYLTPIRLASVMGHVSMVRRMHMKTMKVTWKDAQDVNEACGGTHAELFLYTLYVDDGRGGELATVYQGHSLATFLKGQFDYLDYRYKLTTTAKSGAVVDVTDKMKVEVSEKPGEIENPGAVSALHIASGSGHADVVEYLLSAGAEVNARDAKKRTPLIFAAASAQLQTMDMLITAKPVPANLEACAFDGSTAMHFAAFRGAPMCLGRLASAGANKEATTIKRESPLHFAAKGGHREVWYRMFDLGAEREAKDVVGMTAMEVATAEVDALDLVLCTGEVKVVGNGLGVYKLMPHPNLFLKPTTGDDEIVHAATVIQKKQRGHSKKMYDDGIPKEHKVDKEK